jgi:hypothetical protein
VRPTRRRRLEEVAVVESRLRGDGRLLEMLVAVAVAEERCAAMVIGDGWRGVDIVVLLLHGLLKVNAGLLLRLLMLALRLAVQPVVAVMVLVDFDWLSNLWLVLPSAHAALHADQVARLQRRVAPQARHEQREQRETHPALAAAHLVGCAAAARARMVDEVALRVAHAVVEHAASAHHARNRVDAALDAVRRESTRALAVPLLLVELLAIPKTSVAMTGLSETCCDILTHRHRSLAFISALSFTIDSCTSSGARFFRLHVESLRLSIDDSGSSTLEYG